MISILKPGLLTTLQDLGRYGFQKNGMVTSGAMDPIAHRIANILVGNKENDPSLELTLIGPTIKFYQDCLIAICGGDLSPTINDEPVKLWRPVFIRKGSILRFSNGISGCRAYLAIAGGFQIPSILKSKSTYLRGAIGGYKGRALAAGDHISIGRLSPLSAQILSTFMGKRSSKPKIEGQWTITSDLIPNYSKNLVIRVMKGRHFHLFGKYSQLKFFSEPFKVTPQSDRMGYRLNGQTLSLNETQELISEAVTFGTIQVPGDGNPIILLADRQTTGGYPKIAEICTVDLPLIAQAKPGDSITFKEITHSNAQISFLKREKQIQDLKIGIALKYVRGGR